MTRRLSAEDLLTRDEARLAAESGLPLAEVREAQAEARGRARRPVFRSLAESLERGRVASGLPALDELLGGGFLAGHVTELVEASYGGATLACLWCAADVLARGGEVAYVDTRNALEPSLLRAAVLSRGGDERDLERARYARAFFPVPLLAALEAVIREPRRPDMVIVDSIYPVVSQSGVKQASSSSVVAQHVARALRDTARHRSSAVVVVNGLVRRELDRFRPGLGQFWSHVPSARVLLERKSDDEVVARLLPWFPGRPTASLSLPPLLP